MQTARGLAALTVALCAAGCGQAAAPEQPASAVAAVAPGSAAPSQTATPTSESTPTPLMDLAGALGLAGRDSGAANGLVPGGDCPAPTGDVASEIAAQAEAAVPLKVGLTLSYSWMRTPQEEYECLIHVTKIEPAFIETSLSCNHPDRGGPFVRRVCRSDLRHARMLHTVYGVVKVIGPSGDTEPETIVGATAFSMSSDEFARMKRSGTMNQHYVELGPAGELAKNGVGELRVEGRETMRVIVNDQPLDVPVIKARGTLAWTIRGQSLETEDTAVIVDDQRFPLFIDQQSSAASTASRIQFSKITYPSDGGAHSLESGLLENRRVDVYGIYFDFNSDRIRKESEPVLNEIGSIMKKYPDWRLRVAGHTDNVGGNGEYNLQLSRRRSEAVRRALVVGFGIAADRLSAAGYGAGAPIDANDTPEGRARNRRVELVRQ
jgi:outer membrane protein OmpA-like peptidoglycan-associated protein